MKTERSIICGKHLLRIRRYLGITQKEFGIELGKWGIVERDGSFGKSPAIIASWESGRNQVPDKVIRAIYDNVRYQGKKIQWAYLSGESEYITKDVDGILDHLFWEDNSDKFHRSQQDSWVALSEADIDEIANSPINRFSIELIDKLLPLYEHSQSDFFDIGRFCRYMYVGVRKLIDDYIYSEKKGR